MIHDVVEVGTPTTKAVAPISNKRHPVKTLAAKLLTVMMNHVD